MTKNLLLIAGLIAALAPAAAYAQGRGAAGPGHNPAPTSPVTGNAANGKALYYSYACYACHGYNGETGARAFVGNWGNLGTEETFLRFLRGRANYAPKNKSTTMPNFAE